MNMDADADPDADGEFEIEPNADTGHDSELGYQTCVLVERKARDAAKYLAD
jgi:hypothetical protein